MAEEGCGAPISDRIALASSLEHSSQSSWVRSGHPRRRTGHGCGPRPPKLIPPLAHFFPSPRITPHAKGRPLAAACLMVIQRSRS